MIESYMNYISALLKKKKKALRCILVVKCKPMGLIISKDPHKKKDSLDQLPKILQCEMN